MPTTTDYSSIYTVKDFYQTHILPLFFDKDKLALATSGTLGLFLDITGTTTEDMINIMGRYINEIMPGRAELPDFIYANAANYGITDILAKPAKASMLLLVKEDDVNTYGKTVGGHKEFVIDSDMSILIDDLYYSIPFNIKIRSSQYNGEYNHMAFYDMDYINSISEEKIPFIKTMKTLINGDVWLVLRVTVYQYVRQEYNIPINTNSILNIPYSDVEFSDQLCNFEVFYTPNNSTKEIQLIKRMDNTIPLTDPFVFYKFTSDTSLRLSFANDDRYFLPDYGSNIRVLTYETKGSAGIFGKFKEGLDVNIRADTKNEDIAYNRNIFPMGLTQGDSKGGRDQLQLGEIKTLTSEAQVTVKSYTTDNDLDKFFNSFASIYKHDAKFVRQRDDIAGRDFGCFTRVGDGVNIFPTNTLDMRLDVTDIDKHFSSLRQYIVKAGTRFQYENSRTASIVKKKQADAETEEIEYAIAPLMVITTKPNKVSYYMNTIDHDVQVDYKYFNADVPFNFVVKNLNVYRNAVQGEEEYTITLQLARVDGVFNDVQATDFELQSTNGEIEIDKFKVIMTFDTNVGNYVELQFDHQEEFDTTEETEEESEEDEEEPTSEDYIYTFVAKLKTTDVIDNKRILLTNLLKRENSEEDERLVDIIDPKVQVGVFYDYDDIIGGNHEFTDIGLVKSLTLCNIYEPQDDEFYFAFPLNFMRSHVIFEDKPETPDGFGFYIKQVPLFGADFLLDKDCDIDRILTDIASEHEYLSELPSKLHALFTINMKFYCTYGRSRSFYIGYGNKEEILNHVNCSIELGIKFYDGIIVEDYLEQIRIFVKDYFEKINKLASGANQVFISSLNQQLHNNFKDQIEYLIFYSVNGYDSKYQVIKMTTPMDESPLPDFVPEYLTLKASDVIITTL